MHSMNLGPERKSKRLWTYAQMGAELPESNLPTELWNGEIIRPPTPTPLHQTIVAGLMSALDDLVRAMKAGQVFIGPLDVVLTQSCVVQPDVLFVSTARRGIVVKCIDGAPDLAIEVVTQESATSRPRRKEGALRQVGIAEYWIVDPESRSIEVLRANEGRLSTPLTRGGFRSGKIQTLWRVSKSSFSQTVA